MSLTIEFRRTVTTTYAGDLSASEIHAILDSLVGGPAEAILDRIEALDYEQTEAFWTAITQRDGIDVTDTTVDEDADDTDWSQVDATAPRSETSD